MRLRLARDGSQHSSALGRRVTHRQQQEKVSQSNSKPPVMGLEPQNNTTST